MNDKYDVYYEKYKKYGLTKKQILNILKKIDIDNTKKEIIEKLFIKNIQQLFELEINAKNILIRFINLNFNENTNNNLLLLSEYLKILSFNLSLDLSLSLLTDSRKLNNTIKKEYNNKDNNYHNLDILFVGYDFLNEDELSNKDYYYGSSFDQYKNEMSNYPLLTYEEEQILGKKIKSGDLEARDYFICCNLRLVINVVKKYMNSFFYGDFDIMDLISEGNNGLIRAVDSFDFSRELRFSTFAVRVIVNELNRAVQNKSTLIRKPSYTYQILKKYNLTYRKLIQENGITPTLEEVASHMNISIEKLTEILNANQEAESIYGLIPDSDIELIETISDNNPNPEEEFMEYYNEELIKEILKDIKMTDNQRFILEHYYGLNGKEKLSVQEIAKKKGVTRIGVDASLRLAKIRIILSDRAYELAGMYMSEKKAQKLIDEKRLDLKKK